MPRLFVAVDLPDPVKREVAVLCRGLPGVRWLSPDHMHLTLRFIGEVDPERMATIRQGLTGQAALPFTCRIQGVGRFPARGKARVIWAGVQAEAGLSQLAEMVEHRLREIGISPEERPFFPHITLARVKDISQSLVSRYMAAHEQFQSASFTVRGYHLYSSLLTPKGAVHTRIQ